jgi:acetoin utilization deacetylase AcuC-like enzyme
MHGALRGERTFSLLRPPGHHATPDRAMGFCYLNSVAVAALAARAPAVRRVAVFDFDVHHGNGTEDILVDRPDLGFFSIHQYPAYPGTGRQHRGSNCFNYPVPPGLPRAHYREVAVRALDDLREFKPDLLAVSAGFDAYARDPLCQQQLEVEDYHWFGQQLAGLSCPMFSVLEGGYSDDLPELVLAYLRGVVGLAVQHPPGSGSVGEPAAAGAPGAAGGEWWTLENGHDLARERPRAFDPATGHPARGTASLSGNA